MFGPRTAAAPVAAIAVNPNLLHPAHASMVPVAMSSAITMYSAATAAANTYAFNIAIACIYSMVECQYFVYYIVIHAVRFRSAVGQQQQDLLSDMMGSSGQVGVSAVLLILCVFFFSCTTFCSISLVCYI
jgi:hypothetical protein